MASSILIRAVAYLVSSALAVSSPAQTTAPADTAKEQAREAFLHGQESYDRGQYDDAIRFFQAAQQLAPAALLIFNVAQALRLKGDCSAALDHYQSFLKQEDARPDLRKLAQTYVDELAWTCGPSEVAGALADPPAVLQAPVDALPKSEPQAKPRQTPLPKPAPLRRPSPQTSQDWVVVSLLTSGATLAAIAGGVMLWNAGASDEWSREDEELRQAPRSGPDVAALADRQNANDDRLRTIQRRDDVALGSVVAGGLLLVAGGAVWGTRRFGVKTNGSNTAAVTFTAAF